MPNSASQGPFLAAWGHIEFSRNLGENKGNFYTIFKLADIQIGVYQTLVKQGPTVFGFVYFQNSSKPFMFQLGERARRKAGKHASSFFLKQMYRIMLQVNGNCISVYLPKSSSSATSIIREDTDVIQSLGG
jgi:hypothetical protein